MIHRLEIVVFSLTLRTSLLLEKSLSYVWARRVVEPWTCEKDGEERTANFSTVNSVLFLLSLNYTWLERSVSDWLEFVWVLHVTTNKLQSKSLGSENTFVSLSSIFYLKLSFKYYIYGNKICSLLKDLYLHHKWGIQTMLGNTSQQQFTRS